MPTVRSEPVSTNYFSPTCVKIHVSYVELDFGDGVQGKGAVPLPLLSDLEAVLKLQRCRMPYSHRALLQEVSLSSNFVIQAIRWDRCPTVAANPLCRAWLTFQSYRGLSGNTLDAYSRGLEIFLRFLSHRCLPVAAVTRTHIGTYLASFQSHTGYSSNATVQQRVTVLRLFYSYLLEEGVCQRNPVGQKGSRALVRRERKLPWIPSEGDWQAILTSAMQEPVRNRVMLTFAYDAGLRREELCNLCTDDIDPSRRMIRVRAENTKGRRDRVVPYSATSGTLLATYLDHRRTFGQKRGPLFLSESRRNYAIPITIWSWSKIALKIGRRAGIRRFTTHTLRHLCLTDLARAGWDIHEIATFAGHRSVQTTLLYIHLSGRDLAKKLTATMAQVHARRIEMLAGMMA